MAGESQNIDVDVDKAYVGRVLQYQVRLTSRDYQLIVNITPDDASKLTQVQSSPWVKGALKIGTVNECPAWWSTDDENGGKASILVGLDDQTWNFGVFFGTETLELIVRRVIEISQS